MTKPIPPATVEFSGQPIAAAEMAQLAAQVLQAGQRVMVTRGGRRGETGRVIEMRGETAIVKLDTLTLFYGSQRNLEPM